MFTSENRIFRKSQAQLKHRFERAMLDIVKHIPKANRYQKEAINMPPPARHAALHVLWDLLGTQKIDDISASEIIQLSQIGRSTFYRTFGNKYDCLLCLLREKAQGSGFFDFATPLSRENVATLFEKLQQDKDRFRHALSSSEQPSPYAELIATHTVKVKAFANSQNIEYDNDLIDTQCMIYAYGTFELLRIFVKNDPSESLEEICNDHWEMLLAFCQAIDISKDAQSRETSAPRKENGQDGSISRHLRTVKPAYSSPIKNSIWTTCKNLLLTKGIDEIKTSEIISKSAVGRSTFYRNFSDKYDAVNYGFARLYHQCFLSPSASHAEAPAIAASIQHLLTTLEAERSLALHAFSSTSSHGLKDFTSDYFLKTVSGGVSDRVGSKTLINWSESTVCAYVKGIVDFLIEWIRYPSPSIEIVANSLASMVASNTFSKKSADQKDCMEKESHRLGDGVTTK